MNTPKDFWNQRFSEKDYAYGTAPNEFFKQEIQKLTPGRILLPAEGEGRNAVFAAKLGWQVTAFDISKEGKRKAELLAKAHKVSVDYQLGSIDDMDFNKNSFDVVASIYAHFAPLQRIKYHRRILDWLKPGGVLILEGFEKEQLKYQKKYNSGGPQKEEMLFSMEDLKEDFSNLDLDFITTAKIQLAEGQFHEGLAAVIRLVGKK